MSRPDRHASIKINKVPVTCKCPICHTIHTEQWGCRPDVTPWRYCKQECGLTKNQPERNDRLDCPCYKFLYSMGRLRNK